MRLLPLSVVIISRNEEANIARCIQSAQPITDDIIVIDSGSTDHTIEIAQELGARVFSNPWQGYSRQKNFGNARTRYPYIFSIDADEAFSSELRNELVKLFGAGEMKTAYKVNLINHYCNKPIRHGAWYPDWHYRLFNKTKIHWVETDDVHESLNINEQTSKGALKEHLYHFTTQTDQFYLSKMENYARLFADKMSAKGKQGGAFKAISSAAFRFFKEYVLQLGFLDGSEGFKIAKAHYLYTLNKYIYLEALYRPKNKTR